MKTIGLTFPVEEPSAAETFTCPHCGKEYKSEAALARHIADKHLSEDPDSQE